MTDNDRFVVFHKIVLVDDEDKFELIDEDYLEEVEKSIKFWFSKDENGEYLIDKETKRFISEINVN